MKQETDNFIIYSDIHYGAPTQISINLIFNKNTVFLGDNFDIKNTLKKNLNNIKKLRAETRKKCIENKGIYVYGNHSLEPIDSNFYQIRNQIMFLHGDVIEMGYSKSNLWRRKMKGKSIIYWMLLKYYRKLFNGNLIRLKRRYLENAHRLAKSRNCKTIIMGHFHPKSIINKTYKGTRIIIVPRGKSVIKL